MAEYNTTQTELLMEFRRTTCVRIDLALPLDVNEVGEKEKFDLDQYKRSY
jgi:hypothetical protein